MKNISMRQVLCILVMMNPCLAVGEMQGRTLFYSFMSFKAGLEQKMEKDGNQICFGRSEQTSSRFDLQMNLWKNRQKSEILENVRDMDCRFILGQPDGPAKILLEGGKQVFTHFKLGKVEGLMLVFENLKLVKVAMCANGVIEKTWMFDDSGLTTVEYNDKKGQLVIFIFEEKVFVTGKLDKGEHYSRVRLGKKDIKRDFLVPEFEIVKNDTFVETKNVHLEESYVGLWFKVLSKYKDNFMKKPNENLRQAMGVFKSLSHIVFNFMGERSFLDSKLTPFIPKSEQGLNCSDILRTRQIVSMSRTGFTGFPGSGNTWVRFLLEASTGIATQSQNPPTVRKHQDSGCFLTFSHYTALDVLEDHPEAGLAYPMGPLTRLENLLYFNGRSILLIRNPFKAIISSFVHLVFGTYSDSEFGILAKDKAIFRNEFYAELNMTRFYTAEFEQYAADNIEKWTRVAQDWIELGDTLVVHLEDVVENKDLQIRRILSFLGIDPDERRLKCVKHGNFDIFKRQSIKFERSPFPEHIVEKINNQIEIVNKTLLKYGHRPLPTEKYKQF